MIASLTVLAGIGTNNGERLFQVRFDFFAAPAEHEHVHRHAIVFTKRRMGQPIAANIAKLELFQWQSLDIKETKKDKEKLEKLKGELADVFLYAIEMAVLLDLDSEKIIRAKLARVEKKYPAALMRKNKGEHGTQEAYLKIKQEYRAKNK